MPRRAAERAAGDPGTVLRDIATAIRALIWVDLREG
jgi:hypothetical protein